jgi:hypothetical protein
MEKRFGYLKMLKHQKTNILPLRWIGNFLGGYAVDHLVKAVYLDEDSNLGMRYKYHAFMWKHLNRPYDWWGTYYILDIDNKQL